MLADMATGIEAARLLTYKSAYEIDRGRSNTMLASMAKVFAGDHCNKVCADAVQIFGGAGFNVRTLSPPRGKGGGSMPRKKRFGAFLCAK